MGLSKASTSAFAQVLPCGKQPSPCAFDGQSRHKKGPIGAFFMDVNVQSTVVAKFQIDVRLGTKTTVFVSGLLTVLLHAGVVL